MSERTPGRPDVDDELAQAYARAQALAGGSDGPSAAVRANVLAAAQAVAAQAAARRAAPADAPASLAPVAPPVADAGRGRPRAVNLASWRVRAGAASCAAALVAVAGWRLDALRRDDGAVQVASATRAADTPVMAEAPALPPPPKAMPLPAPAVQVPAPSEAARAPRDKDIVVAQAYPPYRSPGVQRSLQAEHKSRRDKEIVVAQADQARGPEGEPLRHPAEVDTAGAAAPADAARRAAAAPVIVAAAPAPMPAPAAVAQAPAATMNSMAAAPAPRAVPAPAAAPAPSGEAVADAASVAEPVVLAKAAARSAPVADVARRMAPAAAATATSLRMAPAPLQAAADRGDVEALKTLLAEPGARVDAPDAEGRTALLHAVLAQRAGAVRLLLAAGADPGRADHAGLTPREAARAGASAEIAALLAAPR